MENTFPPQIPSPQPLVPVSSSPKPKTSWLPAFILAGSIIIIFVLLGTIIAGNQSKQKQIDKPGTDTRSTNISSAYPSTPQIQNLSVPEMKKIIFKSDTETYLKYKYLQYDIASGQITEVGLPVPVNLITQFKVANDFKHYLVVTENDLFIVPIDKSAQATKVFSITAADKAATYSARIVPLHSSWSLDGSRLIFSTDSILDLSGNKEIRIYTAKADGTDLKLIKTLITNKMNNIHAYDSVNNLLYYHSFIDDNGEFIGTTDIIDTQNGSIKGQAAFMDDKNILDDIIFSPDMRFAFYRVMDNNIIKVVRYDIYSAKEQTLYTFGKNGGNFLIALPEHLLTLIDFDRGKMKDVRLLDYETNKEEFLYNSSEYDFAPLSFSPDGRYIWTVSQKDYNKPVYAIFDLKTHKMTQIKPPANIVVKLSAMENINWLP